MRATKVANQRQGAVFKTMFADVFGKIGIDTVNLARSDWETF
jgi:hypothetical protein